MNHRCALVSISRLLLRAIVCLAMMSPLVSPAAAATLLYQITLNGANESPTNSSLGAGSGTVTVDNTLQTMQISLTFLA